MPPIMLSRDEFISLKKIVERPRSITEIPDDHTAKFLNYRLARRDVLLMRPTQLGQLEVLRQRFRGISLPERIALNEAKTRGGFLLSGRDA
ncbi:MAG: hypothetical protein SGJ17_09300 [Hyphomicrobiales bacterium]|nr:hypothetical protein [Hyphomicrobiales bacterium]